MKQILLILVILISIKLWSEEIFSAKVYMKGSNKKIFLFDHYNTILKKGNKTILTHYYSKKDSSIATIDEVVLENGRFKSSKSQFLEVNETGSVIRDGNKMTMIFEKKGKIKQKVLNYPSDLLVGPLFNDHIIENWKILSSGEKIYFKLPAPSIQKVATFTFQKVENSAYERAGCSIFKLDIASFFLKLLVRPSYFVYDNQTKRLIEIHGNTILRTKRKGKWRDTTDVDIYYTYKE